MPVQLNLNKVMMAGTAFHYVETGHGEPVVFVHGAVSDHRYWAAQIDIVSAVARCYALDQRYFGPWKWPEDGPSYGIMNHADDLFVFIQDVVGEPVHVVATSYGGGVAIAMAAGHPAWVRSLCLHEPALTSFLRGEEQRTLITKELSELAAVAEAMASGKTAAALMLFVDWIMQAPGAFDRLAPYVQQVVLDNAHTLRRHLSAQRETVTFEHLQNLTLPVTLVCGMDSRRYFRLLVDALNDCLPRSAIVSLPSANHLAPVEQPELFTQQVLAHLARNAGAAA